MCREVGNSDDDVGTSEDEEKKIPESAEIPSLLHPRPGDDDHPPPPPPQPGVNDEPRPGQDQGPQEASQGPPGDDSPPAATSGTGTRVLRLPRGRPPKPKPPPIQRGWTVEGRDPSAASEPPPSILSPTTLR